jgi:NADH-quinone oxidoreductase subunit E
LHMVHDQKRCVSNKAMEEIAEILELSPSQIHDTLSFYGYFRTEEAPLGETRVWICRSLPCMLRGGEQLLSELCSRWGIQPGETTADGKITLELAECLGACDGAPCIRIALQTAFGRGQRQAYPSTPPAPAALYQRTMASRSSGSM